MKKWIALALALILCLGIAGCASTQTAAEPENDAAKVHQIGVIVYNTGDEEVIGFREYLKGYIEENFEMVKFVYSGSILTPEEELKYIQEACDQGVEGFLSFLSYDLAAEVAACEQNKAYYLLASGTVSDEDFNAVADNPWFLGSFGPGPAHEFQAGVNLTRHFLSKDAGTHFFILSGGAAMGNEMHYQRTLGILDTLSTVYGLPASKTELAASAEPTTVENERLSITVCPGYVSQDQFLQTARAAYAAGSYDVVLSVLPPLDMMEDFKGVPVGVVDSYNTRNLLLFSAGHLDCVIGKYSSSVGPSFALMLNAVTGHAADYRQDGKAVKVVQDFWISESLSDYIEKYTFSTSATMNAYNFNDLARVIRLYSPDATLDELIELAENCSYQAVRHRRNAA